MGASLSSEGDGSLTFEFQWVDQPKAHQRQELCEPRCLPRSGVPPWLCCTTTTEVSRRARRSPRHNESPEWDVHFTEAYPGIGPTSVLTSVPNAASKNVRIVQKPTLETSKEATFDSGNSAQSLQRSYGPQSKRGNAQQFQLDVLVHNEHAQRCFAEMQKKEEELCGNWAVFYHSYTHAALLYEVQAAVAAILFSYRSDAAPLPRIRVPDFQDIPDATTLKKRFEEEFANNMKDHHPVMRAVAISVMCSVVSKGPEVSTPVVFIGGYKHSDDPVPYREAMEDLLWCCRAQDRNKKAAQREVGELADKIVQLAQDRGLDVAQYRLVEKRRPSWSPASPTISNWSPKNAKTKQVAEGKELQRAGHMLQVFVRRDLVSHLAYAAKPWGAVCEENEPLSAWLNGDTDTSWGQARLLAHPEYFMSTDNVRMYVHSAGPEFHAKRGQFQQELNELLKDFFSTGTRQADAMAALSGQNMTPQRYRV